MFDSVRQCMDTSRFFSRLNQLGGGRHIFLFFFFSKNHIYLNKKNKKNKKTKKTKQKNKKNQKKI